MRGPHTLRLVVPLATLTLSAFLVVWAVRLTKEPSASTSGVPLQRSATAPVLVAAVGDIACEPGSVVTEATCRMQDTADLISSRDVDGVLLVGDLQYDDGTLEKFRLSFENIWGKLKTRLYPAPGNHEYGAPGARGYFDYFGDEAGEQGKGYYSFDLGAWHIVSLNSNCGGAGGCGENSPQGTWLKEDVAANPAQCTLAFWHHPRFSSGRYHPGDASIRAFWDILYAHDADVVLNGHDHLYERFTPMDPQGEENRDRGIRQFTVGTGGRSLYQFTTVLPTSEARDDKDFGVLFLTLGENSYDWEFVPEAGKTFMDSGSGNCH